MQRRAFLAGLLATPLAAAAHDQTGTDSPFVTVVEARLLEGGVEATLLVENHSEAELVLQEAAVSGADVNGVLTPFSIPGQGIEALRAQVVFDGDIPGLFTLMLDFGAHGSGPVLIMPA